MANWKWIVGGWMVALLAVCPPAGADDAKPADDAAAAATTPAAAQPSSEEIARLIGQLDSDTFAERQAASDALAKIGPAAIEPLAEAATGRSLEVTVRSLAILTDLLDSSDETVKASAKKALEKVAKSDRPTAARRAADALKELEEKEKASQMRANAARMAIAGGGRRVSIRTVNGVKTIEIQEADTNTKIESDPNKGIKVEITTKKNGKETTEKVEAKDAEELKKKNPKAYEYFEKYGKQGGNGVVQMQFGGGVVARAPMNTVDTAARILPALASHISRLASDEAIKQASKDSNIELKKKVAEVQKDLADLENRLQKAIDKQEKEEKEKKAKEGEAAKSEEKADDGKEKP